MSTSAQVRSQQMEALNLDLVVPTPDVLADAVITAACRQHHVSRLYLFGSLLRPDYCPGQSDIDLLVEFQPLEPSELVDAYFGLEEQLTGSLGTPVDLVMADAVRNPYVRRDIEASKQLIFEA